MANRSKYLFIYIDFINNPLSIGIVGIPKLGNKFVFVLYGRGFDADDFLSFVAFGHPLATQ